MAVPVGDYRASVISSYVNVAFLTIALWDALCTSPRELRCIWGRRWTLIKILYLLSRYSPIVIFLVYTVLFLPPSPSKWNTVDFKHSVVIYSALASIEMLFVEALLISRLWALWDGTRRATIWLSLGFAFLAAGDLFSVVIARGVPLSFGLFSLFYFILLILTCIRARRISTLNARTPFINTVIRDGILYYASLLLISLAGLGLPFIDGDVQLPSSISARAIPLISSISACRMTLSLRETGSQTAVINGYVYHSTRTRSGPMSALAFASNGRETDDELAIRTRDMAAATAQP